MKVRISSSSRCHSLTICSSLLTLAALFVFNAVSFAQESANAVSSPNPQPLITQTIDETELTTLTGNTHPLARPQYDLGTAPATLPMERMLLVLKRSPQQEASLEKMLDDQQDKKSPSYHHWLTPAEFGKQFGPTHTDIQTITTWLQSHGFQVSSSKGRTVLEFSGSASQVQEAFHTTIHKYLVNGEQHWANASDPQIPTALTPAIAGIASLNNFPRKAMNVPAGVVKRENGKEISMTRSANPLFTYPPTNGYACSADNYCFDIAPYDFATIYNVLPLWNSGVDGTGVTIAISGETDIQMSDVQAFRGMFGLPANDPVFVNNGPDPGIQGDEPEADIDVQWSGAVAKGATIDFVISQSTETTSGVDLSAVYIVDQNLAPIMSESYGECELGLGTTGNQFYNALWQQASAEGITVFISAGDAGSAGCDNFDATPPAPAQYGLQVSGYASTPYNVAVGGTDFNEFTSPTSYWRTNNQTGTEESALSYIPEITWDSSCTSQAIGPPNFNSSPETNCNNPNLASAVDVVGGSGGVSACTTPSAETPAACAGGYTRPSWQTGNGSFSSDGKRDLPDVSLFASSGWAGTAYVICEADYPGGGPCPSFYPRFGGTSVSSPAFAGIMALINQKYGRQGNANYVFYKLAQKSGNSCTSAVGNGTSSSCIFNDVTIGTNEGPCVSGSQNCVTNNAGDTYGVMSGYSTGVGYDMATGLGSVNANNLVKAWTSASDLPSVTTLSGVSPTTITHGQAVNFTVTVAPQSGSGTPTGAVSLTGPTDPNNTKPGVAGFNLASGTVSGSTDLLPGGSYSLTAHYPGDATYAASDSTGVSITVNPENSAPQVFLVTLASNGQVIDPNTTTAAYGSPYVLRVNVENSAGKMCNPAAASGATACPTGTVTMTDNGTALDVGTYTLNSFGYFEDQTVQLTGGTNSIKAAYSGDNSFNANSVTTPLTITPAATSITSVSTGGPSIGSQLNASVTISATSSGVAPTGTVTFLVNGTAVSGTPSYSGTAGSASSPTSTLLATITTTTSPFTTAGSYTIGATYSGDQNYAAATAPTTTITVQYPVPAVTVSPATQNVNPGSTASLTALVDTSNKTVYPTGTVAFVNQQTGVVLSGPTTCASTKDSSGNYACQASASITANSAVAVQAQYSGDTNYPASGAGFAQIVVNDFSLGAGSVTATQGSSSQTTINVSALGNFNGTVSNFSCTGLPAEATCTFNPTSVSGGQGSTTLTISAAAVGQLRHRVANEKPGLGWMAAIFPIAGIFLIGIPARERKKALLASLLVLALIATFPSCSNSGNGGGGGSQNNPVPSITSLSPTQQVAGSAVQPLTINGTNFMTTSTLTYNGLAQPVTYVSATQLTTTLTQANLATANSYPVVVTNPSPGGGPSGAVNFDVVSKGTPTGTFNVTVTASSGSLTHSTMVTVTVQSAN